MTMDIEKLRRKLSDIALHPAEQTKEELIFEFALALLEVAEGIADLRRDIAQLPLQLSR
jgi:hypothetical protein